MTTAPTGNARPFLKPRQIAVQVIGFAIGLALLGWCIATAIEKGDWSRVFDASPWLIAGLAGCSIVSLLVNGTIFWLLVQPVRRLRFGDMQYLNLVTSVLNYAPIRAGLMARIAYHLRVDRMTVLEVGAYFAAFVVTLLIGLAACVAATLLRPSIDWLWILLVVGQVVVAGVLLRALMGHSLVRRYGRGMDQMLRRPACLWGALGLRLIDIGAFIGRMACAVSILGPEELDLGASEILLLAFADLTLTLNPLGRIGYREVGVAFFAAYLGMSGGELEAARTQLALINSAGEAMVAIPLGALALLWYRRRWIGARRDGTTSGEPPTERMVRD